MPTVIRIVARGGGTVIATAPLTITSASDSTLPGLPRVGDGGMATLADLVGLVLAGLVLVARSHRLRIRR